MKTIRAAGDWVEYMARHREARLTVHSVFNGAINLIDSEDRLLSLVDPDREIGPMTLQLEFNTALRSLENGDVVRITLDSLHVGDKRIDLSELALWEPMIQMNFQDQLVEVFQEKLNQLFKILEDEGKSQGLSPLLHRCKKDRNTYCDFIRTRFEELLALFARKDTAGIRNALSGFLGFGPGLTPSTDDFMTGVLLTFHLIAPKESEEFKKLLVDIPKIAKGKTTKISEEMLWHASRGKAAESYGKLMVDLFDREKRDVRESARNVLRIGSSSGTDFLFGVYTINKIRLDNRSVYHGFI